MAAGGVLADLERMEERHAVGQHGAENTAEAGDGEQAEGGADHGDFELPALQLEPGGGCAHAFPEEEARAAHARDDPIPVAAHQVAQGEHKLGGKRFLRPGQQRLELGDEKHEGQHHDQGAHAGEQGGVDQRPRLAPQFLEALDEARQTAEDLLEKSGALARLNHGGVEGRGNAAGNCFKVSVSDWPSATSARISLINWRMAGLGADFWMESSARSSGTPEPSKSASCP